MARRKSLRSQLYRAARDLGNVEAAADGPTALVRRQVCPATSRRASRGLGGLLKSLGLGPWGR
jgi:hypothetical protein